MEIVEFNTTHIEDLKKFLSSQVWKFYEEENISITSINNKLEKNHFLNTKTKTYLCYENNELLGMIRYFDLEDIDDEIPMFDIKVNEKSRGKGIGTYLLLNSLKIIFEKYSKIQKIEATTREDNIAMQKLFEKCNFKLWGKSSKSWKTLTGDFMQTYHYELLKENFNF